MRLIEKTISNQNLIDIIDEQQSEFIKAVVDIEKGIMVIDAELHSDEEIFLLDNGSIQNNLWGINIYPTRSGEDRIKFDSVINIRPRYNNRSRGVEDLEIQNRIIKIVNDLIQ